MTDQMPRHSTFGEREQEIRDSHRQFRRELGLSEDGGDTGYLLSLLDRERGITERLTEHVGTLMGEKAELERERAQWERDNARLLEALEGNAVALHLADHVGRRTSLKDARLYPLAFVECWQATCENNRALLAKHKERA